MKEVNNNTKILLNSAIYHNYIIKKLFRKDSIKRFVSKLMTNRVAYLYVNMT